MRLTMAGEIYNYLQRMVDRKDKRFLQQLMIYRPMISSEEETELIRRAFHNPQSLRPDTDET